MTMAHHYNATILKKKNKINSNENENGNENITTQHILTYGHTY